jgi:hypothetical protein
MTRVVKYYIIVKLNYVHGGLTKIPHPTKYDFSVTN